MKPKQGFKRIPYWVLFAAIVLFAVYNSFWQLDNGIVYDWDEARQGANALEMLESGDYLVNTFRGEPDYWNVKPPLSLWQTALSLRIFGYNTLGLRFFSALWLLVIVVAAMLFLRKCVGAWSSLATGAVLAGLGMRFHHLFRTGDPDAPFFLCCFFACMFLYLACTWKPICLIGVGLATAFAFLAKSMHVFPLMVVILLSLLILRRTAAFRLKALALYLVVPMGVPVLLWAAARFSRDGLTFFRCMLELDVWNRVTSVVENHSGGFSYYFVVLYNLLGGALFWALVLTNVLALLYMLTKVGSKTSVKSKSKLKQPEESALPTPNRLAFLVIYGLMFVVPLAVYTVSKTKLGWYMYPCMIGFAFLTGWSIQSVANDLSNPKQRGAAAALSAVCAIMLAVGVIWRPYENIDLIASRGQSSADSIFLSLPDPSPRAYYVADANGHEGEISQSWLLHSRFMGMEPRRGGHAQYLEFSEANPEAILIVSGDPALFADRYAGLRMIAQTGRYTAFDRADGASEYETKKQDRRAPGSA